MGGTGLEPVTPSLSSRSGRSRMFAAVRLIRFVEPDLELHRTFERTRANAERCHRCRADYANPVLGRRGADGLSSAAERRSWRLRDRL
jgi:hypothetical protein